MATGFMEDKMTAQRACYDEARVSEMAEPMITGSMVLSGVAASGVTAVTAIIVAAINKRKRPEEVQAEVQKVVNESFNGLIAGYERQIAMYRTEIESQLRANADLREQIDHHIQLSEQFQERIERQSAQIEQQETRLDKQRVEIAELRRELDEIRSTIPSVKEVA